MKNYYSYIKNRFRKIAPIYDWIFIPFNWVRGRVLKIAGARQGDKILDLGTGTGSQALIFAKNGFEVTGVDLSPEMIKIARAKNKGLQAKFLVGDTTNLPFSENSFDLITTSFVFHEMPLEIIKKSLEEVKRTIKNNGRLIIIDFVRPKKFLFGQIATNFIRSFECRYYYNFTKLNLPDLLKKYDINILKRNKIIFGLAEIIECEINKN